MIVCIDGTGASTNQAYDDAMNGSFCHQICNEAGPGHSKYLRGPGATGVGTKGIALKALGAIREFFRIVPHTPLSQMARTGSMSLVPGSLVSKEELDRGYNGKQGGLANFGSRQIGSSPRALSQPLYLSGYSRGGAAAVQVAKWLNDDGIPVKAMFLFDPVARDAGINADKIPPNVAHVYVIFRDEGCEHRPSELCTGYQDSWDDYSRVSFGNSDTTAMDPSKTKRTTRKIYNASHGAVGGAPWQERAADRPATVVAASAMTNFLRNEGLGTLLSGVEPYQRRGRKIR